MQKIILLLTISLLTLGCTGQQKGKSENPDEGKSFETKKLKTGLNTYAIVWNTPNIDLVVHYAEVISQEFTDLYERDIIENAYFDAESVSENMHSFPNVAFFLKAYSEEEAVHYLERLTIVRKGVATYKMYPVGMLWLPRNEAAKAQVSTSYVAVWFNKGEKPGEDIIKEQYDQILNLWNQGKIENVYFNIERLSSPNDKTDFVFFVNASSKEEAENICESLPLFQNNLSTFELQRVGVFWFGRYQDQ